LAPLIKLYPSVIFVLVVSAKKNSLISNFFFSLIFAAYKKNKNKNKNKI
jgi:hypothetical protein